VDNIVLYIICLVFGGAGAWLISRWGKALGLMDKSNERSSHKGLVPKGGGMGILAAFLFPFYADELTTMAVRIKDGENLLRAHRRHLYQVLANEKGVSQWKVSLGYGLLQLVVGVTVLLLKVLETL